MGESHVTNRLCKCGCGQIAKRHFASDGTFKSWRSYASGHAPNEGLQIIVPDSAPDLAYMAGIVDGEGCIHARIDTRRNRPLTYLSLQITMCSNEVLFWVSKTFGGTVYTTPRYNPNHNQKYIWRINGKSIKYLLLALLPYLKEKRERAILGIQLATLIENNKYQDITETQWQERRQIISELKYYNRRGLGEGSES